MLKRKINTPMHLYSKIWCLYNMNAKSQQLLELTFLFIGCLLNGFSFDTINCKTNI